jgi:hypothetical protein
MQASVAGDSLHRPASKTIQSVETESGKWQSPVMMATKLVGTGAGPIA